MRYSVETIKMFALKVLTCAGMENEDAEICADCLVTADVRGVHSHGMTHLKDICDRIEHGTIRVDADIIIEQTAASTLVVNANHSTGMVSAMRTMEKCVELAEKTGVAFATIHHANTYGYGAYYPMCAAKKGMIGFSVCNTKAYVAPYGGGTPALGTNPISLAIPAGKYPNLVLDMATSQVAVNKIALAMKMGKEIPADWAVGPNGETTTDPSVAYQGALLPFGGYKGYGLQLVISVLAYALAGGAMDCDIPKAWVDVDKDCNFGCIMGAIDVSKFMPLDQFKQRADTLFEVIKSGVVAPGVNEILIPGERAYLEEQRALEKGVELADVVLEDFRHLAARYGIEEGV